MRRSRALAVVAAVAVIGAAIVVRELAVQAPGVDPDLAASPIAITAPPLATASPETTSEPDAVDLAWGPTADEWSQALADAGELTLEQAAGQVLMVSVDNPDPAAARALLDDYHVGGVIVMGGAVGDREDVEALTASVHASAADRSWPALIAVDHEGGPVARLSGILPSLPAFMSAGAALDKAEVRDVYTAVGVDMHDLGFTVNFAPVADVTLGLADPVIRTRSAGSDPENVSRTVEAAVEGLIAGGVAPTVKHFPGHGSVTTDSHLALPLQDMSLADLERTDVVPFARAIDAGVPLVMMSHVALDEWGDDPASVAPGAYQYLREELGFTGVAITDAFNMRAVTDSHKPGEAAVKALNAGADIVLMPVSVDAAHSAIVRAVQAGDLPRERLDEAAARGIALARWQESLVPAEAMEGNYARALALAGATVVAPLCGTRLVEDSVHLTGGRERERAALAAALAKHGVEESEDGTHVALVGTARGSAEADVVVALAGPWALARSDADAFVSMYGRSNDVMRALADVLAGEATPAAHWPTSVGSMPYGPCPSPR